MPTSQRTLVPSVRVAVGTGRHQARLVVATADPATLPPRTVLELWVRDSEHKSHVSGCVLEPCSGDVVIDVAVDDGQCLA
jgi:hypothetical protein